VKIRTILNWFRVATNLSFVEVVIEIWDSQRQETQSIEHGN
jgi:hypothetical protein